MTMTMVTQDPEFVSHVVEVKETCENSPGSDEFDDQSEPNCSSDGSVSTNRVSGEPDSPNGGISDDGEESESESESEGEDEEEPDEAMPDGDSNADLHALLAFSKSRLQKAQAPSPAPVPIPETAAAEVTDDDSDDVSDDESVRSEEDADAGDMEKEAATTAPSGEQSEELSSSPVPVPSDSVPPDSAPSVSTPSEKQGQNEQLPPVTPSPKDTVAGVEPDTPDSEIEVAKKKLREAEEKAQAETPESDPAHLLRLAEQKVKEAEVKARKDEVETGANVIKPAIATSRRSEANAELWALLNYSKRRLETGSTPQMTRKKASAAADDQSVSSKMSVSSRKSMSSKKSISSRSSMAVTKAPLDEVGTNNIDKDTTSQPNGEKPAEDEFPQLKSPEPSVHGGSVGSGMKGSIDDEESYNSESEDDGDSDEEEEEEEDELPTFLRFDESEENSADTERLYQAARSYGASVLSVAEDKLSDVQMLQAIAVAEEAARNGDDKFSTKTSLFRLHEAKLEDLKSFLDFAINDKKSKPAVAQTEAKSGWGSAIGRGKLLKRMSTAVQDFKKRCDAIDEKNRKERQGTPSNKEIMSAAILDLKRRCDEYDRNRRERQDKDSSLFHF